jgi:hypothetical protein
MNMALIRWALILSALAALPSVASAQKRGTGAVEKDVVEVAAPEGVTISTVRIDNRLGDVTIHGHDSESIKIQSFKRAADAATLERLVVSLVPDAQGRVRVTTALRGGAEFKPVDAGSIAVDLIVFVPRHSAVDAEIWKGTLEVSKVDNGAQLLADKGRIQVKQVSGRVISAMRKGDQDFKEVFGDLDMRSLEGDMRLDTIRGEAMAVHLVRGKISGEGLQVSNMRVRSVFGDVELTAEFVPGGNYSISSREGDVALRFHGQTPVTVRVLAKTAMIGPGMNSKEQSAGRWQAAFGKRKSVRPAQLEVRSETGSVLVKHF